MEKALVTGGAGFIGSHVVDALIDKGLEVVVVDDLSSGSINNVNGQEIDLYNEDITNSDLWRIFRKHKPDYVFHLAAQINVRESIKDPIEDARTNILGSLNVLKCSAEFGVKKFVFSSTGGAIYGEASKLPTSERQKADPESPYGISKQTTEKHLWFYKKNKGLDSVALRYGNVYGPRQNSKGEAGVISIFANNILCGKDSRINGDGEQTRDYVYVKDVADANLLAMELSGVYNVGTGIETSVNEVFRKIIDLSENNAFSSHEPAIKGEVKRSCLDSRKLVGKGWKTQYNLDRGLKETIDYFRSE